MATLATTHPTLLDFSQRLGADDRIMQIIELLTQQNEVLEDMTWIEANELTGHTSSVRTGIPAPTWRKLYGGVQPTKSTTAKVTDTCGMLENYAEIDKALADLNGNSTAWMLSEHLPILEGFNQELVQTLFYGNEGTEPEAFTGFAPRFNAISGANNGDHVISGGGSGSDNTSIWLVVWGPNTAHGIYPKGSKAGFQMNNKGQVTIESIDGAGGRMEAYRTHYRWDCGLTVRDWRYIVRVCNIDVSDLTYDGATGAKLMDLMTQALEICQGLNAGRPVFYCNRTIKSFLRRQIVQKVASSTLSMDTVAGKHVMFFDGVPVKRCDGITSAEATVS